MTKRQTTVYITEREEVMIKKIQEKYGYSLSQVYAEALEHFYFETVFMSKIVEKDEFDEEDYLAFKRIYFKLEEDINK